MKTSATIIGAILLLSADMFGQASTEQPQSRQVDKPKATPGKIVERDMVLVTYGQENQSPGTGWERKTDSQSTTGWWERRVKVEIDISKAAKGGDKRKHCSVLISQFGTLPAGDVFLGPILSAGMDRNQVITFMPNQSSSAGLKNMLLLNPTQTVTSWWEF